MVTNHDLRLESSEPSTFDARLMAGEVGGVSSWDFERWKSEIINASGGRFDQAPG